MTELSKICLGLQLRNRNRATVAYSVPPSVIRGSRENESKH